MTGFGIWQLSCTVHSSRNESVLADLGHVLMLAFVAVGQPGLSVYFMMERLVSTKEIITSLCTLLLQGFGVRVIPQITVYNKSFFKRSKQNGC